MELSNIPKDNQKKVVAVIQVRIGSTRLPKKILLPIAGKTALEWIKYRLSFSQEVDAIVVSTSDTVENDPIEHMATELGLPCYRGSEDDLIERIYQTAKMFGADAIVRITADCPLVDPFIVDQLVRAYRENPDIVDHVTNIFPPTYPDGLDVEVMPFHTLEKLHQDVTDPLYREWITTTIMEHPDTFEILNLPYSQNLSYLRMTLDYEEDLDLISNIFEALHTEGAIFGLSEILDLFARQPDLIKINKDRVDEGILNNVRSAEFHNLKKEDHSQI